MLPKIFARILPLVVLFAFPTIGAGEISYWVWDRAKPLGSNEAAGLLGAGVSRLYWHAGTIAYDGSTWKSQETVRLDWPWLVPPGTKIDVVPVLRIRATGDQGLPESSFPDLARRANQLAAQAGTGWLQLDYECPDRLIPNYLAFLQYLKEHGRNWRLSISALGHWSKFCGQFASLTDEITPMFYDLDPQREHLEAGTLPPLVDEPSIRSELAQWQHCPIPWWAGLPNFSRLTLVGKDGLSLGNVRHWGWDDIWFSPLLQPAGPTRNGETCFAVTGPGAVADTPIKEAETLVARYPSHADLLSLASAAQQAGATGVLYFRLAGPDDMSGYTPMDLSQRTIVTGKLSLHFGGLPRLILTNGSNADLMPQVTDGPPTTRGYCLIVRAPSPLWRDVLPGEFAVLSGPNGMQPMLGPDGTTLRFWFSHLAAGHFLETGLVEKDPALGNSRLQWRVDNLDEKDTWHDLTLSPQ